MGTSDSQRVIQLERELAIARRELEESQVLNMNLTLVIKQLYYGFATLLGEGDQ